jgi:AraC-like DNA-binding protein
MAESIQRSVFAERSRGAPYIAEARPMPAAGICARDYFKILVVTGGTGRMTEYPTESHPHVRQLAPGNLMLLRPDDLLRFRPDGREGFDMTFVSFSVDDWRAFSSLANLDPSWMESLAVPIVRRDHRDERLMRPFRQALMRYDESPTPLDLVQFLSSVAGSIFPSRGPTGFRLRGPFWLRRAVIAMAEDEENLRVGFPRLLEFTHVSRSYLAVTVRRHYGMTPSSLLTDLRLRHAARLLATTDDTIATIAARCGFESVPYFSTAFRRANGVTPRDARSRSWGVPEGAPFL